MTGFEVTEALAEDASPARTVRRVFVFMISGLIKNRCKGRVVVAMISSAKGTWYS